MLKILLVDDEKYAIEGLISMLDWNRFQGELTGTASSGEEAVALMETLIPDVIISDIKMGGMNGIEAARRVRQRSARCLIVFLTTSREYAFDAFPVHPFDYLIKPYRPEELARVLASAFRFMSESETQVEIRLPRQSILLAYSQIAAVASHGHTVDIFTVPGACLKSSMTFSQLDAALRGDERFLPCNRGILINMDEALKLDSESILMANGMHFPLRQRNRLELINRFTEYQLKRMIRR